MTGTDMERRQFLIMAAVASIGGLSVACSDDSTTGGTTPTASAAGVVPEVDGDITWFNWSQYVDPSIIKAFEKEYGVTVKNIHYSSVDEAVTKVAQGTAYDLANISSTQIQRLLGGDLLARIDVDKLTNYGQVDPFYHQPPYDPEGGHAIPYAVGGMGIAYQQDLVSRLGSTWADFWTQADTSARGHMYVVDDVQRGIGMSLLKLGYSQNSAEPSEVREAADALIELKPSLAGLSSSDIDNVSSGRAWMQQAWAGDMYYAIQSAEDPEHINFQWCSEGELIGADQLVITAAAEHPGTAALLIDWLLDPENSATNVGWTGYPNGTTAGNARFDELTKKYPFLQESQASVNDADQWLQGLYGERLALYTQEWTRVVAA
jgi:spermidine/putrescine transport system substrate-binding protein